jgi:hypothetical protein
MSIGEWLVYLDKNLQVTRVKARNAEDEEPEPDPNNGPLGIMFTRYLTGCVYDEWTATLKTSVGWGPKHDSHTWANVREGYPDDDCTFYTNAVYELGAFANVQAWLKSHD